MQVNLRSEWLADLLSSRRDLITEHWIEDIRAEGLLAYRNISDEQLRVDLPPTVDSMIEAFRSGETEGARRHSIGVIQRRLAGGFLLPDLQSSLHALETAVMNVVRESAPGIEREYEALQVASNMYYLVALIAAGVYEQLRAEQQKRFASVYELGTGLSRDLNLDSLLTTAVVRVAEIVSADSVAILLPNPDHPCDEVRAYHTLEQEMVDSLPDICAALGCEAVSSAGSDPLETPVMVSDVRTKACLARWSDLLSAHQRMALVDIPLVAKQRQLGHIVVLWQEVHNMTDPDTDYLLAIAGHVANAVQNAILYQEAQGKHELGVLLEASRLFSSSLDTDDILRKMARMAAEAVDAELAVVLSVRSVDSTSHRLAYYAGTREATHTVREIVDVFSLVDEEEVLGLLGRRFANGESISFNRREHLPERLKSLSRTVESGLVVPLRHKDELVGAFAILSSRRDAFTDDDLLLAMALADLAAVAIENARIYEYERNIAETLQRIFLPWNLPAIEGFEVAAVYKPALAEAEVGGDFYDGFSTDDGKVSLIIGDVAGKGLGAAVPTAMGKYVVRAYAAENPLPSSVVTRLGRVYMNNAPENVFMTAFYGTLCPADGVFTYVSAGHNPPIIYSAATGVAEEIPTSGICLGVVADAQYVDMSLQLQPGDVLLLFTDGATDIKGNGERLNVEGLERLLVDNAHRPAQEIVQGIFDGIVDFCHGRLMDDVARVALKRNS